MKNMDDLAQRLFGTRRLEGSEGSSRQTATIMGKATSNSSSGAVEVIMSEDVLGAEDENGEQLGNTSVELPTTMDVVDGEDVIISLIGGENSKTPIVTGVIGGGDRLKEELEEEIQQAANSGYCYKDDDPNPDFGTHVVFDLDFPELYPQMSVGEYDIKLYLKRSSSERMTLRQYTDGFHFMTEVPYTDPFGGETWLVNDEFFFVGYRNDGVNDYRAAELLNVNLTDTLANFRGMKIICGSGYNLPDPNDDYYFIVGNGSGATYSNAFAVKTDGTVYASDYERFDGGGIPTEYELYSGGTTGTVTLSDDSDHYDRLRIFFGISSYETSIEVNVNPLGSNAVLSLSLSNVNVTPPQMETYSRPVSIYQDSIYDNSTPMKLIQNVNGNTVDTSTAAVLQINRVIGIKE